VRINKYLRDASYGSRRGVEELIEQGKVKVNGNIVRDLAFDVSNNDVVEVDGKIITGEKAMTYVIMNKPKGYITTKSDDKGRKTVMQLLPANMAGLFPVGRLDYNTEGLLLFTNDGELANHLTAPKNKVRKKYIATIKGDVQDIELNAVRNGFYYKGVRYGKCECRIKNKQQGTTKVEIVITEGKNHEIRNMFEYLHKDLHLLKRVAIGDLMLTGLNRGEYRKLSNAEVQYLKSL